MIQFRTNAHGELYRLIEHVFDSLRGRTWVLVEAPYSDRPQVLPAAQWNAMAKHEPQPMDLTDA